MTNSQSSPYSPAVNFFRAWGKDEKGRWVYVGLNHAETQELLQLQGAELRGDDLVIVAPFGKRDSRDETDRYLELHDKHEAVRLQLCMREVDARQGLAEKPH